MRNHVLIVLIVLVSLTAACTLSGDPEEMTLEATPIAQEPTQTPAFPTLTLRETTTPTSGATVTPVPTTCSPRTDWISYTVVSGDTLGNLARRTNSTVDELVGGNCLEDPDLLRTGQQLYLPRVPVAEDPPTATPPGRNIITVDPLDVAPVLRRDGDTLVLPATQTIRLTMRDVPTFGVARVTFYVVPSEPDAQRRFIGDARVPGEGTPSILYTAPTAGTSLSFLAEAQSNDDTVVARTEPRTIRAEVASYDPGGAAITQILSGDAGNVSLLRGATATLTYQNPPPGTTRVTFIYQEGNTAEITTIAIDDNPQDSFRQTWTIPPGLLGQYTGFAYAGNDLLAIGIPLSVTSGPPPGQGCMLQVNAATNYYDGPSADGPAAGSAAANETFEVLGRSLNGWYGVNPDGSGSGAGGVEPLVWLPVDGDYTEGANCN